MKRQSFQQNRKLVIPLRKDQFEPNFVAVRNTKQGVGSNGSSTRNKTKSEVQHLLDQLYHGSVYSQNAIDQQNRSKVTGSAAENYADHAESQNVIALAATQKLDSTTMLKPRKRPSEVQS